MSIMKSLYLGSVLCLIALVCLLPTSVSAQNRLPAESAPVDRDQTLRQLLTEVHELRLALQRVTITNTRFQLLLERLRAQQGQVDTLSRQLATVRAQLTKLKDARTGAAARMKELEDRLSQPSSNEEHGAIESALKDFKRAMDNQAAEEQQQQLAEADLVMRLQVEQGRLSELNNQLDVLMNELKGP